MSLIQSTGTYRATSIKDLGLGKTKKGFPQLILSLSAEEVWDEDEKIWVNCKEADSIGQDILGYLVLVGGNDCVIFHHKQVMKVLGWDGISFAKLSSINPAEVKIQWRVDENLNPETNQINLKVANIDIYDAEPGKLVQKLTAAEVAELDAKYSNVLRKVLQGNKPIIPVNKPTLPWVKPQEATPLVQVTEEIKPNPLLVVIPDKPVKATKPPKKAKTVAVVVGCTEQEAWDTVVKNQGVNPDDTVAEIWCETVEGLAPGGDETQMNPELWAQARDIVVKRIVETNIKI
jgi:hypothetical protein